MTQGITRARDCFLHPAGVDEDSFGFQSVAPPPRVETRGYLRPSLRDEESETGEISRSATDCWNRRCWSRPRRGHFLSSPSTLALTLVLLTPFATQAQPPAVAEKIFGQHNVPYDGSFTFVRLRYTPLWTGYGRGGGYFGGVNYQWDHDYPRADRNFMQILDELTGVEANTEGHNILSVGDPEIFKYPLAFIIEPGWMTLTGDEAKNLRAYLLKGGFLIFDDFAGERQLGNFLDQLRLILPAAKPVRLGSEHPIFHAFFDIDSLDFYHPYQGVPSEFLGVYEDNDPDRRLLLIANYNNDVMESWEFSDTGFIPIEISNAAYQLGVNYVTYAMTH